ncbi:MAG: riboflavin synthase [Pseudanabaenaceae cyanobacterium]|jgi:riboflavin synthase
MFTGLVQTIGRITHLQGGVITLSCPVLVPQLALGDSVAVNGVCLTVVDILAAGFRADLSPETQRKTNLGDRLGERYGDYVNLEPALRVGDKIGGHFVSGHIDGIGKLLERHSSGNSWELTFSAPPGVGKFLIYKGSIAVNGVSLTISACTAVGDRFTVAVIPHTYDQTNLKFLALGDSVNLEADMLGKYVAKLYAAESTQRDHARTHTTTAEPITAEFLTEHGWA